MINGIINVYKEAGFTSHDVVAKLRGILKQKKIGHTGTLDPDAVGVLPVCLGNATKLCDMLTDKSKEYEACMLLGVTTDTQDISGTVLEEKEVLVDEEQVKEAILSFIGEYDQIPPMYSAIKVNGHKLYELARQGKEIERKPRRVEIQNIQIKEISLPEVTFTVSCSKGTYIRTLCVDIGEKLGCGATMKTLKRTRVGIFKHEDALTLGQIEELTKAESLLEYVVAPDAMFEDYSKATVKPEFEKILANGNKLFFHQLVLEENKRFQNQDRLRIYNSKGIFTGIYEFAQQEKCLKPYKMFFESM